MKQKKMMNKNWILVFIDKIIVALINICFVLKAFFQFQTGNGHTKKHGPITCKFIVSERV